MERVQSMQRILVLLNRTNKASRIEDLIGLVMLTNSYFLSSSPHGDKFEKGDNDDFNLLSNVLFTVGHKFVVQMILTIDNENIQEAGLSFMANVLHISIYRNPDQTTATTTTKLRSTKDMSIGFLPYLSQIIQVFLQEKDDNRRRDIAIILRFLASINVVTKNIAESIAKSILSHPDTLKSIFPASILDLLSDLVSGSLILNKNDSSTKIRLSDEESHNLIILVMQCLHGAAQEGERDLSLRCVREILCSNFLSSDWMQAKGSPKPKSSNEDAKDTSSGNNAVMNYPLQGSFPVFIVSIIFAEMHLIEESLLFQMRDYAKDSSKKSESTETSQESHVVDFKRLTRGKECFETCISIFQICLVFLCEKDAMDDDSHRSVEQEGQWRDVSVHELLRIKALINDIVGDFLEFCEEFNNMLLPYNIDEFNKLLDSNSMINIIRSIVCLGVKGLYAVAAEDSDISQLLTEKIVRGFRCSSVPFIQFCIGSMKPTTLDSLISSALVNAILDYDPVLELLCLYCDILTEREEPVDMSMTGQMSSTIPETISFAMGAAMIFLLPIRSDKLHEISNISMVVQCLERALKLVYAILTANKENLIILARSEGVQAIKSVFMCDHLHYVWFYDACQGISASDNCVEDSSALNKQQLIKVRLLAKQVTEEFKFLL